MSWSVSTWPTQYGDSSLTTAEGERAAFEFGLEGGVARSCSARVISCLSSTCVQQKHTPHPAYPTQWSVRSSSHTSVAEDGRVG